MKSMCHDARRNSPSVADCRPTSSCSSTDVADRVVLDRAQLVGVDPVVRRSPRAPAAAPAGAAGCRRGRLGTAESYDRTCPARYPLSPNLSDVAHVTFEFAPLQLAPARGRRRHVLPARAHAGRARRAGAGVAPVVLVRRAGADGGDARLPARAPLRGAVPRAHGRAPAARRPRRAAARARADRPAAAPRARAPPACAGCASSRTRSSRSSLWAANFYVWHLPALYQGAVEHDAVHALQHMLFVSLRDRDVDGAARPAAQAGVVRQRLRRSATSSPSG